MIVESSRVKTPRSKVGIPGALYSVTATAVPDLYLKARLADVAVTAGVKVRNVPWRAGELFTDDELIAVGVLALWWTLWRVILWPKAAALVANGNRQREAEVAQPPTADPASPP